MHPLKCCCNTHYNTPVTVPLVCLGVGLMNWMNWTIIILIPFHQYLCSQMGVLLILSTYYYHHISILRQRADNNCFISIGTFTLKKNAFSHSNIGITKPNSFFVSIGTHLSKIITLNMISTKSIEKWSISFARSRSKSNFVRMTLQVISLFYSFILNPRVQQITPSVNNDAHLFLLPTIASVDTNTKRFLSMFHSQTASSSHIWTCCCHILSRFTPTMLPTYHRFFSYLHIIITNFQYLQHYLYVISTRVLNKFDIVLVSNQYKLIPSWIFEYTQELTVKQNNGEMIIPTKPYGDSAIFYIL